MYNGIGLQTARGSGTNGYVQTNKFFIRPKTSRVVEDGKGFEPGQGTGGIGKRPNKDILEHDRKRQIELKLTVLEDKLIDQGYTDAEIAEKLMEARATLEAVDAAASEGGGNAFIATEKNVSDTQTHQIAARKEKQMETLRAAFGISLPEDKAEKQPGLAEYEDDDEKPRHHKKGSSEGDDEYEEGEILHQNEMGEANFGRQMEDSVSDRKFDNKGHRSMRNKQGEKGDYKHKKQGHSRKHNDKKRRAYSSTDTESDSLHSTDSEDSAIDTKGKQRSRRTFKESMSYSSDNSTSDSDDSGGAYGKRGQGRQILKHKKHEQKKRKGSKKKHDSESSDFDTDSEKGRETDSDDETKRKYSYEKSKKSESKISARRGDDPDKKYQKGRSDKFAKSSKRHDSASDSVLETKIKRGLEKSKKTRSNINDESDDYSSDDSEREDQRRGSDKFEKFHKRLNSDTSKRSMENVNDDSDYSSDNSERENQRRGSDKLVKAHKSRHDSDSDSDSKRKDISEKSMSLKSKINNDSDYGSDDSEKKYQQRRSEEFVKAPKRHGVDSDFDNHGKSTSHKMQEGGRQVKRGRHDSEDEEPGEKSKAKRFVMERVQEKGHGKEEHKDVSRGRNEDDEYRRKHVEVADDHDRRHRRDTSRNDDREQIYDVTGVQRGDAEYRRKNDRVGDEHEYRRHRQDEREFGDRWLGDDPSRGQRRDEKEYRRKLEDESDYKRQSRDEEHGNERSGRREEDDYGNERSGRREEADNGRRRHEEDRDSSKRARYEDPRPSDRRHRDHAHYSEDRWR